MADRRGSRSWRTHRRPVDGVDTSTRPGDSRETRRYSRPPKVKMNTRLELASLSVKSVRVTILRREQRRQDAAHHQARACLIDHLAIAAQKLHEQYGRGHGDQ